MTNSYEGKSNNRSGYQYLTVQSSSWLLSLFPFILRYSHRWNINVFAPVSSSLQTKYVANISQNFHNKYFDGGEFVQQIEDQCLGKDI